MAGNEGVSLMPSRKNRPGKHGTPTPLEQMIRTLPLSSLTDEERIMAKKFKIWEDKDPKNDHYVGWPDMDSAKNLEKRGLLKESHLATGCFFVTDKFRTMRFDL